MKTVRMMVLTGVLAGAVLVSCGKKPSELPAIVSGRDTLMAGELVRFDPVSADHSRRLRNVGCRLVCAGGLPGHKVDSLAGLFAERLLLVTGTEWSDEAAALLLNAAQQINRAVTPWSCAAAQRYIDSLRDHLAAVIGSAPEATSIPVMQCDSADTAAGPGLATLLQTALGVQPECAGLIVEFITEPQEGQASPEGVDMRGVVSGLVAKRGASAEADTAGSQAVRRKRTSRRTAPSQDNSVAILRYRDRESIRDSIEKHIPDLRQLYKKSLKGGDFFSGKVVVTIRVNAAGDVVSTAIKATDIDNKLFLDPFIGYVRTIRFKPVAEKLGAMTFDFPFEFSAEM